MKKQNDGNKTKISHRSRTPAGKKDGIAGLADQLQDSKLTAKYTFERSKDDIKNLEKLRQILKSNFSGNSFNTDSEIYRLFPDLYFNAVKTIDDQQLAIDELTAKLDQLQQLRSSFCRIMEICKEEE